ncbi:hypothetical protein T440DRAFT_169117 [Plenodomus tracheiphilus IPT5]|uniref:Uncharacterized protein n=1 Tax=Plenodomus tracheiphilus IPT5 TaxID=1408161 RepID=A0A6A7B100_9PLEO|nr:hypothetical protein T440DRAFT_169117 [Plenodomus tracheiphilus IPT5]
MTRPPMQRHPSSHNTTTQDATTEPRHSSNIMVTTHTQHSHRWASWLAHHHSTMSATSHIDEPSG